MIIYLIEFNLLWVSRSEDDQETTRAFGCVISKGLLCLAPQNFNGSCTSFSILLSILSETFGDSNFDSTFAYDIYVCFALI